MGVDVDVHGPGNMNYIGLLELYCGEPGLEMCELKFCVRIIRAQPLALCVRFKKTERQIWHKA